MLIRRVACCLAATSALALGIDTAAAASANATGGSWGGYIAASQTYTSVSATWAEPQVHCASSATEAAFWVGLDGYATTTVEQAGTEAVCVGTTAEYDAWYEFYPQAPVLLSKPLAVGDVMTVTVSATSKDVFTLTFKDATAGWSSTFTHTDTAATRLSAEVIAEVPSSGGVLPSSSGSVTFTAAKVDGAALGAADPFEVNGSGVTCGALLGGTQFTCTWP